MTRLRTVSLGLCLAMLTGCVTKLEPMSSNFGTAQNGPMCYTVAEADSRFNAPTFQAPPLECLCSQLVTVKKMVVKAGDSPEIMSCPAPVSKEVYNTKITESTYAPSLASTYVPAAGQALSGAFTGLGFGLGLANMPTAPASSMQQRVFDSPTISTFNGNVKYVPIQ